MKKQSTIKKSKNIILNVILARFQKGSFFRNLSVVMTGTATAQLILFAIMPIISRLFTPEDFGVFSSFHALLMVISAGVTLQYAQAVVLPKHHKEGIVLLFIACLSVVLITAISVVFVGVFPSMVQSVINASNYWFLFFVPMAIFANGLNQAFQSWCIRVKAFKATSQSQVIRSIILIVIWLVFGFWQVGAPGLVLGIIIADISANLNLLHYVRQGINANKSSLTWQKIKAKTHEYIDFPLFAAPQNIINALSQGLPVFLLAFYYGIGVAGAYAFGIRILYAPINFLLTPLRQVLFQKATETYNNNGNLYSLFMKITGGLMALAFLPCVILFIWSPSIFPFIFGTEWQEAGVYARWLILWLFVGFSNVPAVLCARIIRQQRNLFIFDVLLLIFRLITLIIGGMNYTPVTTIIIFSTLGFISNLFLILCIGKLLHLEYAR